MIYRGSYFLPSYDLAPPPPLFPWASCLSFSVFLCVAGQAYCRERVEEEQIQTTARMKKALYKSDQSILFVALCLWRGESYPYFHSRLYLQKISYFFSALITTISQGLLLLISQCISVGIYDNYCTVQYTVRSAHKLRARRTVCKSVFFQTT